MKTAIWWIRRDLRLTDNQALQAAHINGAIVVPVFIIDNNLIKSRYVGDKRLKFLFSGLSKLDEDLRAIGSRLILRSGSPVKSLTRLVRECDAAGIFAEADHSPYARSRDRRITETLPLNLVGSSAVHPPGSVLKSDGTPYTVFTPFSKAWKSLPLLGDSTFQPSSEQFARLPEISSEPLPIPPPVSQMHPFVPGENEAQRRLKQFLDGGSDAPIFSYDTGRNMLAYDGTSQLSPYLRFGMLSPRQAVLSAQHAIRSAPTAAQSKGAETWLNELIWRDFYIHILYHFPHVRVENFRNQNIPWQNDSSQFDAWCAGKTGYPIVDAAMRQLSESGWVHNRARMIAASFLTKDLLIDWRWGEHWFMQHLIDGDPAANNGGWQWIAGTGTDAAPYFRIFNPVSQSKKVDPSGVYIRRWLPELVDVSGEFVHSPWLMPPDQQKLAGCRIGIDYPTPIVDHRWARERALDLYSKSRRKSE